MLVFFFFQAEDGIRDLVRSRGLGDVYKRQAVECAASPSLLGEGWGGVDAGEGLCRYVFPNSNTVSYTHLTLPTSDLV